MQSSDKEKDIDVNKPVTHPALQTAFQTFIAEGNDDILQQKFYN